MEEKLNGKAGAEYVNKYFRMSNWREMRTKSSERAAAWISHHWPGCRVVNIGYTFGRKHRGPQYPRYVESHIRRKWVKIDRKTGGTYMEPRYYAMVSKLEKRAVDAWEEKLAKSMDTAIIHKALSSRKSGAV